jgi:hypothetical protein
VFLKAAYSLARALVIGLQRERGECEADLQVINTALLEIKKKAQGIEEIMTSAQGGQNAGEPILSRARIVRDSLLREVEILEDQFAELRGRVAA